MYLHITDVIVRLNIIGSLAAARFTLTITSPLLYSESNIIEYVDEYDYQYDLYDDTGMTFEELETATEPLRDPEKKPWWKEDDE